MGERLQYAVELAATAGAGLARMPIAMVDIRYKGKQRIAITRAMLAEIVANFRKQETDVPVDYDHAIRFAAGSGDAVPAAGWIKAVDDAPDADGILWGSVEWTERAAGMIAAKEYKYISPVLEPGVRDTKSGLPQGWTLTSAALTNQPVLQGMPALVMSERGWEANADEAERANTVRVRQIIIADRAARTARVVLDDDTEVSLQIQGLEEPRTVLTLSNVKRTEKGELDFASLDVSGDVLISGEVFRAQRAQLVLSKAMEEGKILPAQRAAFEKMALADPTMFETLVASMKPQVDMGTRGFSGDTGGNAALTDLQQVDAEIHTLVLSKQKEAPEMDYGAAMVAVLHANPALERRRKSLM